MLLRRYHKKTVPVEVEAQEQVQEQVQVEAEQVQVEAEQVQVEQAQVEQVSFEEMTVAELKAYAAANNIDLGEATKKADILAAIQNA